MKAVAYIRVSTEEQASEGRISLPAQRARIAAYAERQQLEIVEWFEDAGVSAYRDKAYREGFYAAVDRAISDPEVTRFLITDLSRFYRDARNALNFIGLLDEHDVQLVAVDEQLDLSTGMGRFMTTVRAGITEFESAENARRVIAAQKQNILTRDPETGWAYQNGGQPLFGYKALRKPGGRNRKGAQIFKQIWVLDDTIVSGRPIYEWVYDLLMLRLEGKGYKAILRWVVENKIPPIRGRFWPISTIAYLFRKPALLRYAGRALWNVHDKRGRLKPESEWVIVEHGQPAIISESEYYALLALGRKRTYTHSRCTAPKSYPNPFQGRFYCGRCGSKMSLWHQRQSDNWYYICSSRKYGVQSCGPGRYLPRKQVELGVMRWLAERLNYPEGLEREIKHIKQQLRNAKAAAALKLAELNKRHDELEQEILIWLERSNPKSTLWPEIERVLLSKRYELSLIEEDIKVLKKSPRDSYERELSAYQLVLKNLEKALSGEPEALVEIGRRLVERLEWDPDGEAVHLVMRHSLPGVPRMLVASTGFEPVLPA